MTLHLSTPATTRRKTRVERAHAERDKAIDRLANAPKGERLRREGEARAATHAALKEEVRRS